MQLIRATLNLVLFLFILVNCPNKALAQVHVDLELALVFDASQSIDEDEFRLQMDGYANAFRNQILRDAILSHSNGVAVNAVAFATTAQEMIPFTLLDNESSIEAFAASLASLEKPDLGILTGIEFGLMGAMAEFGSEVDFPMSEQLASGAAFLSHRQIIDVSSDGGNNTSGDQKDVWDPTDASLERFTAANKEALKNKRDLALQSGIDQINAAAIETSLSPDSNTMYYAENLIGGDNAFVETALSLSDFDDMIERKLLRELAPVPEPSTTQLFFSALCFLISLRRTTHPTAAMNL